MSKSVLLNSMKEKRCDFACNVIRISVIRWLQEKSCKILGQIKTVVAERAFHMHMDTMKQNLERLLKNK